MSQLTDGRHAPRARETFRCISGRLLSLLSAGYAIPAKFQKIGFSAESSNLKDEIRTERTTSDDVGLRCQQSLAWNGDHDHSLISSCENLKPLRASGGKRQYSRLCAPGMT